MQLETERLILRELTMNDLDHLYEILSDSSIIHGLLIKKRSNIGLNGTERIIEHLALDYGLSS